MDLPECRSHCLAPAQFSSLKMMINAEALQKLDKKSSWEDHNMRKIQNEKNIEGKVFKKQNKKMLTSCFGGVVAAIWSPLDRPFSSSANLNTSLPWRIMVTPVYKVIWSFVIIIVIVVIIIAINVIIIVINVTIIDIVTCLAFSPGWRSSQRGDSGTRPGIKRSRKRSML